MTSAAPHRPTVLIVDDSPGVLQNLEYLLAPHLNVRLADSGAAALEALAPDTALLLTDVRMPGLDGVELTRQVRRTHPQLPVVFMTGIIEPELRAQADELDVLDVLRKPLRPGVLFPALQGWLGQRHPIPAIDPASTPASAAAPLSRPSPGGAAPAAQRHTAPARPGGSGTATAAPVPAARPPAALTPERVRQQAQMFVAGLSVLPGVIAAGAFDPQGLPLTPAGPLGEQVGPYVRFLLTSAQTLAPHLHARVPLKASQLEFQDRVLVLCPFDGGVAAVLVRDTPGASSVKAWMRTRLT